MGLVHKGSAEDYHPVEGPGSGMYIHVPFEWEKESTIVLTCRRLKPKLAHPSAVEKKVFCHQQLRFLNLKVSTSVAVVT